jgi:hypothetical protein
MPVRNQDGMPLPPPDKESYFGHLTYHLATALFFTGCRYHEWALLTLDRLVREPGESLR